MQSVHAAHEAGIRFGNPEVISSVVICTVPNEAALKEAKDRLDWKGIRNYIFLEDDIGDQATALATEPLDRGRKKFLSSYPLWREPAKVTSI